ncbi:hypothetical protein ACFSR9_11920 [Deinococcus taklimakanensis]|uniref:Uncharacterized protein n=1 Tax=Deinococcus taklimakanensis TaxID=536443 RepID=A0ABW5P4C4_9DEIO
MKKASKAEIDLLLQLREDVAQQSLDEKQQGRELERLSIPREGQP